MKVGVVLFPDSENHRDVIAAYKEVTKWEVVEIWHKDDTLKGVDMVTLTGGYLNGACFAIQDAPSPILKKIVEFANRGGYVWGIGDGFRTLCKLGLLPGSILPNTDGRFVSKNIYVMPDSRQTAITWHLDSSMVFKVPIAHSCGRYVADILELSDMRQNGQILFRYCDRFGNLSVDFNPDGSIENIAGVANENKNVFGLMAHPERAVLKSSGNQGGVAIFESLQWFFRNKK